MGEDYLESIERTSRLECVFSTVKVVKDHRALFAAFVLGGSVAEGHKKA